MGSSGKEGFQPQQILTQANRGVDTWQDVVCGFRILEYTRSTLGREKDEWQPRLIFLIPQIPDSPDPWQLYLSVWPAISKCRGFHLRSFSRGPSLIWVCRPPLLALFSISSTSLITGQRLHFEQNF